MGDSRSAHASGPGAVRSFVSQFRAEILAEWKRVARSIPVATDLPSLALADHIPDLLDQVAEIAERFADDTTTPDVFESARRHAVDRLGAGFDIAAVMHELSMLRGCALAVWDREHDGQGAVELRSLNLAFDRAMSASVARYVEARERTLSAIDAISTAALEATSLDDLLQRLLAMFMRTTESVQTCAILLRGRDDRLHTRATVGLEEEIATGYSLANGEGFGGHVWAEGRPVELSGELMDSIVKSPAIRKKKLRAIYGVPLVHNGELIGVAHMGSITANQFSDEDRHLFSSMVARATLAIYQHVLRERLAASEARLTDAAAERERALGKLEALLATSPVGIGFIDRSLRYVRINDALASLNGKPVAEHIGRTIHEILPAEAGEHLEPLLARVIETGEPLLNLELRTTVPSGEERSFLATYFPVRAGTDEVTGVGGVVVDVTEMRRAQEALAVTQARLQSIIDHSPVAIYVKDEEGRIILTNERTAQALGRTRAELLGHRGEELLSPEFERPHRAHDLEVMRTGNMVEGEEVVPDGEGTRTFLTVKFPIPGEHGRTYVCGISTEITDRKRIEEELRAAIRARDDVLAIASHDLRNPLGSIQMSASILLGLIDDPRARKHLAMIQRSSARMEHLINDLLDAARIEQKRFSVDCKPERAAEVLAEAVELQASLANEKRVTLTRECPVDVEVRCDRARILQVLDNLIGNAIKFCRAGDDVTISCERVDEHVRFTVTDTGPGIPRDALPHLFDRYWSAPEHAARGAGLGLYIARGIVEAHGGQIEARSNPGHGATFSFTVPIVGACR